MVPKSVLQILHLVITLEVVFSSTIGLSGKRLKIDVCDFGDRQYSIGETWHPYLRPQGTNFCILCTCYSFGQVRCSNTVCPPQACPNPIPVTGKCCSHCAERLGIDSLPTPAPTFQSCQYQDKYYAHGELFSTEDIFLSRRRDQCAQCSCSEGKIYCALKTCLQTHCNNPVMLPDSCCPVCPSQDNDDDSGYAEDLNSNSNDLEEQITDNNDHSIHPNIPAAGLPIESLGAGSITGSQNIASVLTQLGLRPDIGNVDHGTTEVCESNEEMYFEGQTWHPTLFPFGTMKCILCTCKSGIADCGRVECPAEDLLLCDHPIQLHGQCCKVCPESIKMEAHEAFGPQSSTLSPDSTPQMNTEEILMCLKKNEDILFHQYTLIAEDTSRTEDTHQYAIENLETKEVEIHQWRLSEGEIQDFHTASVSMEAFSRLQQLDRHGRFQLMGASTLHRLRKLKRKEHKILRSCSSNCHRKIAKVTRTLKLREISPAGNCSSELATVKQRRKDTSG